MATVQQIQASIAALENALNSGVLSVGHGTDKVIYQSPESMMLRLRQLRGELATAQGTAPRSRVNYIEQSSKGFGNWCDPSTGVVGDE